MIPVTLAGEPLEFDKEVREPGLRAIAEMVGERPKRSAGRAFSKIADRREDVPPSSFPPYWTKCLDVLMEAYRQICAYSCFRIHPVTGAASVDHMAPKSRRWNHVYEWSNYRLAVARLNSRKRDFEDVVDPFDIQDGWFHLELVGFSVFPNPQLDKALQARIDLTIERLGLNDFRRDREHDAQAYWDAEVSMKTLHRESPFVAYELTRQNRLNATDTATGK